MIIKDLKHAKRIGFYLDDHEELEMARNIDDEVFSEVKKMFRQNMNWRTVTSIIAETYKTQYWVPEFMARVHDSYA